jgi:hypothetical protein
VPPQKKDKKKPNKTKSNVFSKKIGTRIGGSIEKQEPNNIVWNY